MIIQLASTNKTPALTCRAPQKDGGIDGKRRQIKLVVVMNEKFAEVLIYGCMMSYLFG